MVDFFLAVLAGLICGVLSGFGIGGGSLLMVWLTALLSMDQRTAQGINLLYFLPAAGKRYLRHLEKSVVIILAYIGVKMLLDVVGIVHISPLISLGVVIGLLAIGILASLLPEKSAK